MNTIKQSPIWADLVHLGHNMWVAERPYDTELRCDDHEWRLITDRMAAVGMNMIVIDLAEGIVYPSHPELAIKGSWSVEKIRAEIARLKTMGIEAIPKINFSACHDGWLGEMERMISTPPYYKLCADLIRDVAEIFDHPRFFHIGFDEEEPICQKKADIVISRQGDLWWHDLNFIAKEVEKNGMRPWMWSDYAWNTGDEFYKRCPKSIVQSNWYYSASFDMVKLAKDKEEEIRQKKIVQAHEYDQVECYLKLEKAGFDQIPCGGNWREEVNFGETVKFCRAHLAPERLLGFLVAPWRSTTAKFRDKNLKGVELVGEEIRKWNPGMVRGTIADSAKYEGLHPRFRKAFEFLRSHDLAKLPLGRNEIDGNDIFANVMDVTLATWDPQAKLEVHRKYFDIHVPISGDEVDGFIYDEENTKANAAAFDVEKDYVLFQNPKMSKISLKKGEFAIFYPPYGAHAPNKTEGAPRKHRKLVVKVRF